MDAERDFSSKIVFPVKFARQEEYSGVNPRTGVDSRRLPDFRNFEAGTKRGPYTLADMHKEEDQMMLRGRSDLPSPVPPLTTLADIGPKS